MTAPDANQVPDETVSQWQSSLVDSIEAIRSGRNRDRAWTFDMDDQPELESVAIAGFPRLKEALAFLQTELHPAWKECDASAMENQKWHKRFTQLAIWPGVAAVSLAIVMLVLSHILPQWSFWILVLELASVSLAFVAVVGGLALHWHHSWLSARQQAERLRSLKFESLGWHQLWCAEAEWRDRVKREIGRLKELTSDQAEHWAKKSDDATPELAIDPACAIEPGELAALASYYQAKRLEFQKNYFDVQSKKAYQSSWGHRYKISLVMFFSSVAIVLLHGLVSLFAPTGDPNKNDTLVAQANAELHAEESPAADHDGAAQPDDAHAEPGHGNPFWHDLEMLLVGLAALLPVLGFGVRAWISAFEFPRSRNLFRAKSWALSQPIADLGALANSFSKDSAASQPPSSTTSILPLLQNIAHSEHFLINEHREWCRLQMEAEWFF